MATPDHTVLARPSVPPDGNLTHTPGGLQFRTDFFTVRRRRRSRATNIAMAVSVVTLLLMDSDAHHKAQSNGLSTTAGRWPLTSDFEEGLMLAVHYLKEYARELGREPKVNPAVR